MTRVQQRAWVLVLGLTLCILPTRAQEQKDQRVNAPGAPYPAPSPGQSSNEPSDNGTTPSNAETNTQTPDTRPLTGAEEFTLGAGERGHGHPALDLHFLQLGDSNGALAAQSSGWTTASILSGGLAYDRFWKHYDLGTTYSGGGALYDDRTNQNEMFQQLMLRQKVTLQRWALLLVDQASYYPEAPFGFGGNAAGNLTAGFGGLETQLQRLSPLFGPNQSILTGRANRVSNTAIAEVEYNFSPRSSATASASYGILRFLTDGFIDDDSLVFHSGYNYSITRHNTLGVIYGFQRVSFGDTGSKVDSHIVQLAYGRRVTGRLALQFSAGPQLNQIPISRTNIDEQISWSAIGSLTYQLHRTSLELSYLRGITGGAGVLAGAQSHSIQGAINRSLSRYWSGTANFGYARNTNLLGFTGGGREVSFNSWHVGGILRQAFGRHLRWFLTYNFQRQNGNQTLCVTTGCGPNFDRHEFGFGLDFQSSRTLTE